MNKTQLLTHHDCKLYDLSDPKDMHRMNMNLQYHNKKGTEPTFKLIAPFGHPMEYKADYYYFENENTQISEQIFREMGFEYHKVINIMSLNVKINCFTIEWDFVHFYLNLQPLKQLNANQLFTLIQLLK